MSDKHVCNLCRTVGHNGAQWIARVDGETLHVHKPCGERLVASAPEGSSIKLEPSKELKQVFRERARERQVRSFWEEKFAEAKARAQQ